MHVVHGFIHFMHENLVLSSFGSPFGCVEGTAGMVRVLTGFSPLRVLGGCIMAWFDHYSSWLHGDQFWVVCASVYSAMRLVRGGAVPGSVTGRGLVHEDPCESSNGLVQSV